MTKARSVKLFAACLVALAVAVSHGSSEELRGSIELKQANALLKAYASHVVDQQPRELRRAWKDQLSQVKLSEAGLYVLTGVDGRIVIEYLPESKTLH